MSKELKVQTEIKNSVIKDGGHARKQSNRFTIGVPDLLIMLPPFAPIQAEVKDLGEVVDQFSLQLEVTPKQDYELRRMNNVYFVAGFVRPVGILLVAFKWRRQFLLVGLPQGTERWSADRIGSMPMVSRGVDQYYDLRIILEGLNCAEVSHL